MLKYFRKSIKVESIYSPINGKTINLDKINDKMFSTKMLGDGKAFIIGENENIVYAPCDGEIIMLAETKHAFGIKSKIGIEILVHVGLNTVNLNGKGFEIFVKEKQRVKQGEPIIKLDSSYMSSMDLDLTTAMVLTNADDFKINIIDVEKEVTTNDVVINVSK
jgi:PTS system, glucose subfamily, IIA component